MHNGDTITGDFPKSGDVQSGDELRLNIYLCGVGGQGIGILAETLLRAYDHAGFELRAVDTHGLAQRGGIVRSHIRVGRGIYSPLIEPGAADIVIALERTEALRGMRDMLGEEGLLLYYDAYWQALPVRLGRAADATNEDIESYGRTRKLRIERVLDEDLPDARMQNMALLAAAMEKELLPGIDTGHVLAAMGDLMPEKQFEKNRSLFDRLSR